MSDRPVRETPGVFRAPKGVVLHLYLPGYVQGHKPRTVSAEGLCAAQGWGVVWLEDVPAESLSAPFRWCGKCIGLALVKFGLTAPAVEAITPYFRTATQAPTSGATQRDGSPAPVVDRSAGGRQQPEELVPVAPTEKGGAGPTGSAPPALTSRRPT